MLKLTFEQVKALIENQVIIRKTQEPPAWVGSEGTWDRAKKSVQKNWGRYSQPWAVVTHVYKKMGGTIEAGDDDDIPRDTQITPEDLALVQEFLGELLAEANTVQGLGQLMRDGAKTKECCGRCLEDKRGKACTKERLTRHVTPLREAVNVDADKREIRCTVLTEGPGNDVDRNYYSRQSVEDLVSKLDGDKSYINHQTEAERRDRGEGDVWGLAGYWKDTTLETVDDAGIQRAACVSTLKCDESEAGKEAFAKALAAIEHQRLFPENGEVYCGLSINKDGMQTGTVEVDGSDYRGQGPAYAKITAFAPAGSADVVTKPARGGNFERVVEAVKRGETISKAEAREMTIKQIIEKHLRESLKKTLEQKDDDDKTQKAKADLVDTAIADVISNLPAAAEQAEVPEPKKPDEEQEPEKKEPAEEMEPIALKPEILEQLKKDIPMHEGESEQDYTDRVGNAMKLMGGGTQEQEPPPKDEKKGEESVKALESFRRENPAKFDKVLAGFRLKLGAERKDFRNVREENKGLRSQLRETSAKLMMVSDLQEAKKLLEDCDVQIPAEMLCEADMVGMSTEEKQHEVEKFKAIVESARLGSGYPRTASGGSGKSGLNMDGLRIVRKDKK